MDKPSQPCDELLKTTMEALNPVAVGLMLLTVQKANLKLSVQHVVKRCFNTTQYFGVQNPESQTEEHFMKIWLFQTLLLLIKNFVKEAHPPTRVKYGTIVTVIVLRHAALTHTKSQVTPGQAFQQACELYFKSDTPVKVEQWFTASPDPTHQEMIEMILLCEL
ncbi:hypothetical protein B0H17DRAFT_1061757 [Mycena rosella]|uniref:Uncharacterized protein n=1 Tax=Mycena rosella TaxID=1033263 RepID=A0AAD7GKD6_MYCRO|nr:hypothetical protein B0H17DRAFT_1061757 [Mycena rosella]